MKTVRVPPEMAPAFAAAEELVARYFEHRRDDPETGTIEIHGERYVLVRAAALSVEFFALVAQLYGEGHERDADDFARNILFDLAHTIGRSDARNFHARMGLADPIARLSAGPVHFAYAGWASVDIDPSSRPSPDDFYLLYDHPYSFESDAWLRAGKKRKAPACVMNAGYSAGWCSESFGLPLVATEILCRARGDEACRFIMAHPDRLEQLVAEYATGERRVPTLVRPSGIPDFFHRKRAEEELRRARDDLRQRQATKLEALGQLAGGIAHDFNNLMSVVIGRSALLLRGVPEEGPTREGLLAIREAGERAATLTRQLLAFGRAQVLSSESVELSSVVRGLSRILEALLGERVTLSLALHDTSLVIHGDRGNLEQVVMNLAVNARDAMPGGGSLRIATRPGTAPCPGVDLPPGRYAVLEVRDDGAGMTAATAARIFDPFFTTKAPGSGTGLGLSTAYGIVRQSGGDIVVESALAQGSTFSVWLPLVDEAGPVSTDVDGNARHRAGRGTVLLVEDQVAVRTTVVAMLESLGYSVVACATGAEAITLSSTDAPVDVLVTDVVMPGIGGRETAARVRQNRSGLPVLFVSGFVDDPNLTNAIAEEGALLLAKPFSIEEIATALASLLGRRVR